MPRGPKEWSPRNRGPLVGRRIELVREVDRYPDFAAPKGLTGTIVDDDPEFIRAKMDQTMNGAEEWGNEVHWHEDSLDDFEKDVRFLP